MSNPNYPEEKKKLDAESQLKALKALPPATKSKLKLKMDVDRIEEFLRSGTVAAKPAAKPQPEPKKAEPVKKEAPKDAKPVGDRLYYGAGKDFKLAVEDCAAHYGILFRESAIRYFPQAHGPFDLTVKDKDAIVKEGLAAIKGNEKVAYSHNGIPMWAQKAAEDRYKYWIDVNFKPAEAKAEPKPEPKPKKEPKPAAPKAEAKAEPKKTPATKAEPKETPKPEAKEAKPETPKKAAKAKAAPKAEAKPEPKPEPKAKKAAPKKEAKPEEPKEEKPAKAKPASKKAEPKKAPAKKAAPKEDAEPSEAFKKAQLADKRLRAVIPNPNYALQDKIADLKAQRQLLTSLSEAEFSKLKYGPKEIDEWLKANQGFEEGQGGGE